MKFTLTIIAFALFVTPVITHAASPKNYKTTEALSRHQTTVLTQSACGNGNDFYDGGEDTDTLQYSGKRSEFHITKHLDKSYTFKDLVSCRADTDTVINVERFEFSDGVRTVSKLRPDLIEKKSNTKKKGNELEALVYTTAGGVPIIRPPQGWLPSAILTDRKPEAAVFFTNPEKTVNLQVAVGVGYSEAQTPFGQAERLIKLYTSSATVGGKKTSGKLVSNKYIELGKASGHRVEIKRTDLGGTWRIMEYIVATVGPDYYYSVGAKVAEKDWKKYKKVIESSFKTLQIPN